MKMGVKEFRERLGEVTSGSKTVAITNHGKIVGHYLPVDSRRLKESEFGGWLGARDRFRARWQDANPDWQEQLLRMNWDDEGEPYENDPRRRR